MKKINFRESLNNLDIKAFNEYDECFNISDMFESVQNKMNPSNFNRLKSLIEHVENPKTIYNFLMGFEESYRNKMLHETYKDGYIDWELINSLPKDIAHFIDEVWLNIPGSALYQNEDGSITIEMAGDGDYTYSSIEEMIQDAEYSMQEWEGDYPELIEAIKLPH